MKILTILCLAMICCNALAQEEPFWEEMPAPATGAVTAMEIDNLGNIYIGSKNGLWRSTNHGDSWEQIINGLYHISGKGASIKNIAINKNNEIAVYGAFRYSNKLFISSDFGDSWTEWEGPTGGSIGPMYDMAWNQNNYLYIIRGDDVYYSNSPDSNWTACETKLNVVIPRCMDIFNDSCIAVTGKRSDSGDKKFLFLSYDNGKSWEETGLNSRRSFCVDFFSKEEVYIGTDKGLLLYEKNTGLSKICPDSIWVLNFHIHNRKVIYIGIFNHVWITRDSGKTWTKSNSVMDKFAARTNNKVFDIVSDVKTDSFGNLYARTRYWGIYRSTDSGESWRPCNSGFFSAQIARFAFDKNNNIYLATNGLFKSTDRGNTWKTVPGFEGFVFTEVFISSKNYIYASASLADSLFLSMDGGHTWEGITEGLGYSGGSAQNLNQIVENKEGYLFATCDFGVIKRSFDDGKSWESRSPPPDIFAPSGEYIAINSEGHLFTSDEDGILSRTTDNFETWELVIERDMMCFSEHGIIFYPNSGIGFAAYNRCLYNTSDNGRTWDDVGYKEYPPLKNYYHPKAIDSLKNLYWLGYAPAVILRSDSLYQHFDTVSSGFNYWYFHTMAVSPDGYVWAATNYGGLYRSRKRFVPVEEQQMPETTYLEARPNPCTESAVIHYALTTPGTVRLSLYNLLGMKAASWNQGLQPPGAHTLTIDTSHLPPGAYLLRLEAGSHRQSVMVVRE